MPADGSCPSPVTSMPTAKPVTATPTAQPSAEPSQSPTTEGERAPSEMPSNPPIKIVDEQEEVPTCPPPPAATEQSGELSGAGPENDYNGYIPKDGTCQSGLGDRCRGFSKPNSCDTNFLENEFYNPGDWYMVQANDYMYCQMPNQDIVCFSVISVNHKEGDELIEYTLEIGCDLPNPNDPVPTEGSDACNPVDGYYFTDFVMKEKNTVYYSWTDANGQPAYEDNGTFITHNGGQRGLSHSSACLAKPPC